jgi:signal peptidase II
MGGKFNPGSGLKILLFCISGFVFVGCDRITKDLAKERLEASGTISYFHDFFRLE